MEKFEQLNSFEETNAFLQVAIHLGWISSEYNAGRIYGSDDIYHFLEKPYKWQSEYEFMVKWVRDNDKGNHIFEIIDQELEEEFLGAYHLWIKGRGE